MKLENKSYLGLFLLSISALFLIPVNFTLAQDLPESTVSARIPKYAAFFPQSDFTMPHLRSLNAPHRGDSFIPHPSQVPFDVAGYPFAPPNLQLEQVCNVSAKMEHAGIAHSTTVGLSVPILPRLLHKHLLLQVTRLGQPCFLICSHTATRSMYIYAPW